MPNRRDILAALSAGALSSLVGAPLAAAAEGDEKPPLIRGDTKLAFGAPQPFSFERLVDMARERIASPYVPAPKPAPDVTIKIGYAQHNAIFQAVANGLFADKGPQDIVTMFHLGQLFQRPVKINALEDGTARPLLYREGYFSYPANSPARDMPDALKDGAGFAGFRVHEPWNGGQHDRPGDWLVFLGASYFRSSGDLKQYGLSSRGLALDTAKPGGGPEEFPDFTEFWITPMVGGRMTIYALMEGPSVTGAYRFVVTHHPHVTMDVTCRIFLRHDVARFGVAPLTSMYWYSQERRWAAGDWRPEVHDSDGLSIRYTDGGALWRPLTDPDGARVTAYPATDIAGFGLMQRDRTYDHYQDRAAFERRPNLYVEPIAGFGRGEIQLVELPDAGRVQRQRRRLLRAGGAGQGGRRSQLRIPVELERRGTRHVPGAARRRQAQPAPAAARQGRARAAGAQDHPRLRRRRAGGRGALGRHAGDRGALRARLQAQARTRGRPGGRDATGVRPVHAGERAVRDPGAADGGGQGAERDGGGGGAAGSGFAGEGVRGWRRSQSGSWVNQAMQHFIDLLFQRVAAARFVGWRIRPCCFIYVGHDYSISQSRPR